MGRDTLEQLTLFDMEEEVIIEEGEDVQECKICKKDKPLKHYAIKNVMSNNLGVIAKVCYPCDNKRQKESYERRKDFFNYPDENYCCPICLRNEEQLKKVNVVVDVDTYEVKEHKYKRKSVWRLDHDHITGKVIGILCNGCNVSKGQLGDTLSSAERLVKYHKGELDGGTGI
jgi:hypothetical protein